MDHSHYHNLRALYNQMKRELDEHTERKKAQMQECLDAQSRYLNSLKYDELVDLLQNQPHGEPA
jgi:hypothetical protein